MNQRESRKQAILRLVMTLRKAQDEDIEIDDEKLINLLGAEHGVASRTAREYLANARTLMGTDDDVQTSKG
jgi:hypothetical protein|tara:strand:+ start:673 stop:885 length:213 start_codon:yes stop_codon:yes gene_type:complete